MTQPLADGIVPGQAEQLGAAEGDRYELTLYVSGASELSVHAIADAKALCEGFLSGRYRLAVVDIYEEGNVLATGLIAAPTLVKTHPLPERRHVGALGNPALVLESLGIQKDPPLKILL